VSGARCSITSSKGNVVVALDGTCTELARRQASGSSPSAP